jgi:hypothetical protein
MLKFTVITKSGFHCIINLYNKSSKVSKSGIIGENNLEDGVDAKCFSPIIFSIKCNLNEFK